MELPSCRIKANDAERLEDEYRKLVEGLSEGGGGDDDDEGAARGAIEDEDFMANPGESSRLSIRRSLFEVADGGKCRISQCYRPSCCKKRFREIFEELNISLRSWRGLSSISRCARFFVLVASLTK